MNKTDILQELSVMDEMGIDRSKYIITYGAALVLHGVRKETSDIDIKCEAGILFDVLMHHGFHLEPFSNFHVCHITGHIDCFDGLLGGEPEFELLEGYQVQTIQSVRKIKINRGREKDLKHVKQIDEFLGKKEGSLQL